MGKVNCRASLRDGMAKIVGEAAETFCEQAKTDFGVFKELWKMSGLGDEVSDSSATKRAGALEKRLLERLGRG